MLQETKLFEVRDKGTNITVLVIKAKCNHNMRGYLYSRRNAMIARAGFADGTSETSRPLYLYHPLNSTKMSYNPFDWSGSRTHHVAHKYIEENWDDLVDTQVICVEYILREREEPKRSEHR